jgi:hypothetical protein
MKKILIAIFLLAGFAACEQNETVVDSQQHQDKVLQRSTPIDDTNEKATGPAAHPPSTVSFEPAPSARVADISFIPNAGVIKVEADGQTHLEALQLPGVPGSRQVIWQSLGTGWQGSQYITMDALNFYVVWGNGVYKIPKTKPNSWSLIVPNNGEDIKGIEGFQTNGTASTGFYLVRGNCMNAVDASGNFLVFYGCNEAFASNKCMAYFKNTNNGGFNFLFREFSNKTWHFTNPQGVSTWNNLSNIQQTGMIDMVGNPTNNRFYKSKKIGSMRIDEINPAGEGSEIHFCGIDYAPSTSSLVVNNGYLWIMSNTLHQVMIFGSLKGQAEYSETGWDGILLACAVPDLVIN